jgi:chemotaxis protein CheC
VIMPWSDLYYDILREVGNIGAGNAATALAELVGQPITMRVPSVVWLPLNEVAAHLGGAEKPIAGILIGVEGQAPGTILFAIPLEQVAVLLDVLMPGSMQGGYPLGELECSALSEIGNILAGAYLSSLSSFTLLSFRHSVPALAIDMAGAVLDYVLAEFGSVADQVLLIENQFESREHEVTSYFFFVPRPSTLEKIFKALGVETE